MIRKAFSMVELIFVIVLLGILASVGGNLLPDNRLLNDTNYIIMKIKDTQKNAIGYDTAGFSEPWSQENNTTCITLTKIEFENLDKSSQKPHVMSSDITGTDAGAILCFDSYGRPYKLSEQKLLENLDINVTYKGKTKNISVLPISGYVTLSD
jgi:prepilin-type N-terminal cleavage/methylation domain-containing protein